MADTRERQRRRKIPLACEPCRERKSRCDGGKPICLSCQRRGLSLDQCIYTTDNARTASKDSYIKVLHDRIHYLEQKLEEHGISIEPFGSEIAPIVDPVGSKSAKKSPNPDPIVGVQRIHLAGRNPSVAAVHHGSTPALAPVNLDTDDMESGITAMGTIADEDEIYGAFEVSGEFYGTSSAASFMQEAMATAKSPKETVLPLMPPQSESGGNRRATGAHHLLDRFWTKVFYLYPIFHRPAFEQAYQNIWKTQGEAEYSSEFTGVGLGSLPDGEANTILFHCALNTIFAIGTTFSDLAPSPKETAAKSFLHKAKSFIGLDLLETNNIGVVQCLLLLAVFLQSTPFPTRTWNAVGVAIRVAQGLGLHTEAPKGDRSQLEVEISRRTWHGCVILDMIVSMTFGRPTMTATIPPRPMPSIMDLNQLIGSASNNTITPSYPSQLLFFNEYSCLCNLLKDILSQVYEGGINGLATNAMKAQTKSHDFKLILELDSKLATFAESLPPILSWKKAQDLAQVPTSQQLTFETQRVVLHGRFLYLQIMLHRPIFTELCAASPVGSPSCPVNDSELCNSLHSSFTIECAKTCMRAAMELTELVHKTYDTPYTGGWWWDGLYACTAGLILIVSQLHPQLKESFSQHDIQRHWRFCDTILEHLTSQSTSVQKSLKLLRKIYSDVMPGRNNRSRFTNSANVQKNISPRTAESTTITDTSQAAIGELVDILPFELMDDSNINDISFDWDQPMEFFTNDIPFETLQ